MSNNPGEPSQPNQTWEDVKAGLRAIFGTRAFWVALVGFLQVIVFRLWPNFPQDVWEAGNLLLSAILVALGVIPSAIKATQARRARARMVADSARLAGR